MLRWIRRACAVVAGVVFAAGLCMVWGCQVVNTGREVRSEEQMLPVTFENARAEELFVKAVKTTYGEEQNVKRIGTKLVSLYSNYETVGWNANCNDHIRKIDKNEDMVITEQEAESYYTSIAAEQK